MINNREPDNGRRCVKYPFVTTILKLAMLIGDLICLGIRHALYQEPWINIFNFSPCSRQRLHSDDPCLRLLRGRPLNKCPFEIIVYDLAGTLLGVPGALTSTARQSKALGAACADCTYQRALHSSKIACSRTRVTNSDKLLGGSSTGSRRTGWPNSHPSGFALIRSSARRNSSSKTSTILSS